MFVTRLYTLVLKAIIGSLCQTPYLVINCQTKLTSVYCMTQYPIVFTKAPQSVIGPGAAIKYPHGWSDCVDYEAGELPKI